MSCPLGYLPHPIHTTSTFGAVVYGGWSFLKPQDPCAHHAPYLSASLMNLTLLRYPTSFLVKVEGFLCGLCFSFKSLCLHSLSPLPPVNDPGELGGGGG